MVEPVPAAMIDAAVADLARRARVRRTPTVPLRQMGPTADVDGIHLKLETLQEIGSFKIRGVYHWVSQLEPAARALGLCTHSAGNTAQALGLAARHFGCPARTLLPDSTPPGKLEAIREYGVEPVPMPFDELLDYIFSAGWETEPGPYLNPWVDPAMLAGNAALGVEVLQDLPEVETIFVPVGGGGLAAGIGSALLTAAREVRLVAVQPESCPALVAALEAGKPTWVDMGPSISDISLPVIVDEIFPLLQRVIDDVVVVSETELEDAIRLLAGHHKLVVEGAGALALAGALRVPFEERGASVCLITGGSVDLATLASILGDG